VHLYRAVTEGDRRPVYLADFGVEGVDDGEFEYPNGVAVDDRARVYVTDRENNRVQVWGY
jgi:DNA-binding beta-propeller fold protein YncE